MALTSLLLANPESAVDVSEGLVTAWHDSLMEDFPSLTVERLMKAARLGAARHRGIALFVLAEEIRKLDPSWFQNHDGSWVKLAAL